MSNPKKVLVTWIDSSVSHGWQSSYETYSCVRIESIGWLVEEDKEKIVIALSRSMSPDVKPWGEVITIPRVAILNRKSL